MRNLHSTDVPIPDTSLSARLSVEAVEGVVVAMTMSLGTVRDEGFQILPDHVPLHFGTEALAVLQAEGESNGADPIEVLRQLFGGSDG